MASTIDCGCHSIRSMLRVLGIYNFGLHLEKTLGLYHKFEKMVGIGEADLHTIYILGQ